MSRSFHPCILGHFGAVVSFPVVPCLAFSASFVILLSDHLSVAFLHRLVELANSQTVIPVILPPKITAKFEWAHPRGLEKTLGISQVILNYM